MSTKTVLLSVAFLAVACSSVAPPIDERTYAPGPADAVWSGLPTQERDSTAKGSSDTSLTAVDILVGSRSLDEDYWEPVEQQPVLGIQIAIQQAGAAVGFETGILFSGETDDALVGGFDVELDAVLLEVYGGVHKSFGTRSSLVRPYLGAGLTAILVAVEGDVQGLGSDSDDDAALGLYVHGGLPFQIAESFRLGLDARIVLGTDVSLFGADGDADYGQLGAVLGFAF